MSHEPLHDLLHRLRRNVAEDFPERADSVLEVPASSFRDPEQWQREMRAIFLGQPLLVALSCDIPEAGDFLTYTIAGRPLLIVRGDDGRARTLLNVCRHRAAPNQTAAHRSDHRRACQE